MGTNALLRKTCAPAQHNQGRAIRRESKLSVETSGAVKTYIAEELPLGSLPRVLKERDLRSTFIACNINA